jgi:hypothetical protein
LSQKPYDLFGISSSEQVNRWRILDAGFRILDACCECRMSKERVIGIRSF